MKFRIYHNGLTIEFNGLEYDKNICWLKNEDNYIMGMFYKKDYELEILDKSNNTIHYKLVDKK